MVILLAIITTSGSLTMIVMIVALIANLLVLSTQLHKRLPKDSENIITAPLDDVSSSDGNIVPGSTVVPDIFQEPTRSDDTFTNNKTIYGGARDVYDSCNIGPAMPSWAPALGPIGNADARIANLTRLRYRDKLSMDGAVVKDAKYYAFHYDDEFVNEENKPWWGRGDY